MDQEQIRAAKEKFAPITDINANKIVLHLNKGELVFLVAKDPSDGKYIIASYRHEVVNGRQWVSMWLARHKEWNGAYIDGEKVMVNEQNKASDYEEWIRLKNEGTVSKCKGYYEYDVREEFQWTLDGEDGYFPQGCICFVDILIKMLMLWARV